MFRKGQNASAFFRVGFGYLLLTIFTWVLFYFLVMSGPLIKLYDCCNRGGINQITFVVLFGPLVVSFIAFVRGGGNKNKVTLK